MAQFTHTNILTTSIKLLKKSACINSTLLLTLYKRPIAIRDKQSYTQTKRWGKICPTSLYIYFNPYSVLQLQHFVRQIPSLGDFFIHNLTLGNIQAFKQLLVVGTSLAPAFIGKL